LNNGNGIGQALGAKVLRQDYPVEVQAVPTSIPVEHGKAPDNAEVTWEMVEGTRWLIPTFKATRIAWIHGGESSQGRERLGRRSMRPSYVVYVPTVELQIKKAAEGRPAGDHHRVICPTRLYDNGLQKTRCFRCNRLEHTSCHANETCGQHDTRKCE
jgi:hypothetical protein